MFTAALLDQRFLAAGAGLVVAMFGFRLLGWSDAFGIFAFALFLFVLSLAALRFVALPHRSFLLNLFLLALSARIVMVYFLAALPQLIEPDAGGYAAHGWIIAQAWQQNGIGPVHAPGIPYDPAFYYLNGAVFALIGFYPIALAIFNAFLGASLVVPIYFWGMRISSQTWVAQRGALLVAFWPSLVYWTSQNLKEAIILLLLAAIMWLASRLGSASLARDTFMLLAASLSVGLFRLLLTPTVIIVGVVSLAIALKEKLAGRWLVGLLVAILILELVAVRFILAEQYTFSPGTSPSLQALIEYRNGGARGTGALPLIEPTLGGILAYLPVGLANYLAGPFPWISPITWRQWVVLPEMLVWYLLAPLAVIGLVECLRRARVAGLIALLYFLLFAIGTAIMIGNIGTMYRQRFETWIFAFVLAAWGFQLVSVKLRARV